MDWCCQPLSKCRIPLFLQRPEAPSTWSKLELTLANSVHEFQTSQSDGRRPIGLETQHGAATPLDRPMILLYDIVQVLAPAYQDVFPPMILSTKSAQTQMTGFVSIQCNFPRPSWCAERKRLAKKRRGRCDAAPRLEQGVHCLALLINCTIQVAHLGPGVVSSTRQDEPTGLALRFHRLSYSGTNRKTHRMMVVCVTCTSRSAIKDTRSR